MQSNINFLFNLKIVNFKSCYILVTWETRFESLSLGNNNQDQVPVLLTRVFVDADSVKDVRVDIDAEKPSSDKNVKKIPLQKWKSFPNRGSKSFKGTPRSKKWTKNMYSDILQIDGSPLPKLPEEEEAVGVITMEDVIEELLQVKLIMFVLKPDHLYIPSGCL